MPVHSTISHEIAATLRDEILRQQYRASERLPSERDLAARFNASRGAVREAESQLEQLGLIRIHPGGARVQAIDSATIAILGPLMALDAVPDGELVDQFLQTFGALAVLTTRVAIERANHAQLNQISEMVVLLTQQKGDFEAIQPQWRELLDYLSEIADNLVVRLISNDLKAQFVEQMMKLGIRPDPGTAATTRLLSQLRKGVANRDGALAAAAMQEYFDKVRLAVGKAISGSSSTLQQVASQRAVV